MAGRLGQSISKTSVLVECSRSRPISRATQQLALLSCLVFVVYSSSVLAPFSRCYLSLDMLGSDAPADYSSSANKAFVKLTKLYLDLLLFFHEPTTLKFELHL